MSVFNRATEDDVARGARCMVVLPDLGGADARDVEARLEEAAGLAMAIGVQVVDKRAYRIRTLRPATLFGQGQITEMRATLNAHEAELVVVDGSLTPVQQSNLEKEFNAKVIDRTGLILEIFGERAASAEGRLQVELAHLDYQAGRLVRSWTHLERQRGGFGFLGGPGETQIEADRRLIRNRMAKLRRELVDVSRTRGLHRGRRQKAPWPVIALVGYTNAGKSTLFNRMTGATVMAEDLLFATLDPTMRQVALPGFDKAILSDTVGFVSNLPTQLVAAFKATLEEVISADLIVHVRDIAHPDSAAQAADVAKVLKEIGAEAPMIEAWNKLDLLSADDAEDLRAKAEGRDDVAIISALTGAGVGPHSVDTISYSRAGGNPSPDTDGLPLSREHNDAMHNLSLTDLICTHLTKANRTHHIDLPATAGAEIAWLHAHGKVLHHHVTPDAVTMDVRMSDEDWGRFQRRFEIGVIGRM